MEKTKENNCKLKFVCVDTQGNCKYFTQRINSSKIICNFMDALGGCNSSSAWLNKMKESRKTVEV